MGEAHHGVVRTPLPALASAARGAIRRAFDRAGLQVASKGTHALRHTLALLERRDIANLLPDRIAISHPELCFPGSRLPGCLTEHRAPVSELRRSTVHRSVRARGSRRLPVLP